jgi:hypothetical protein
VVDALDDGVYWAWPPATAITAAPTIATTLPTAFNQVIRSPRKAAASSTLNTGATAMSRLAVPAGTCTSPQFRRTW